MRICNRLYVGCTILSNTNIIPTQYPTSYTLQYIREGWVLVSIDYNTAEVRHAVDSQNILRKI